MGARGDREALLPFRHLLLPDLLAGLLVERHEMRVERAAEYLAVEDRRPLVGKGRSTPPVAPPGRSRPACRQICLPLAISIATVASALVTNMTPL